jgi:hypothetical protein
LNALDTLESSGIHPAVLAATAVIGIAAYLLPSILGWRTTRRAHYRAAVRTLIIALNLFFGWSGIGWLLALVLAIRPSLMEPVFDALGTMRGGTSMPAAPTSGSPWNTDSGSEEPPACSSCGGSRYQPCPSCGGRGQWWEPATTASGTGQPAHCHYCVSSGKVQCSGCGGSGRSRW